MALGYYKFWYQVFHELGLDIDDIFKALLLARNEKKSQRRKRQKSTGGKLKRRKKDVQSL